LSWEQSGFFIGGAFGASGIEVNVGTGLAGWCAVVGAVRRGMEINE